jgi:hypothetical protein
VVLLTPILLPVAMQLGIDPIHYGTVICATQGISVFMPPVGVSLLVTCSVGQVSPAAVAKPIAPYLTLLLGFTLLITFVPGVVLFLPFFRGCWGTERRSQLGSLTRTTFLCTSQETLRLCEHVRGYCQLERNSRQDA